jgi:hypothetical protein
LKRRSKPQEAGWRIGECFEAAKGEVGLDHCEARSWTGWRRHITLSMIAHTALVISRAKVFPGLPPPGARKKRSPLAAFKKRQRQWSG